MCLGKKNELPNLGLISFGRVLEKERDLTSQTLNWIGNCIATAFPLSCKKCKAK
jgi:hypothetical protein